MLNINVLIQYLNHRASASEWHTVHKHTKNWTQFSISISWVPFLITRFNFVYSTCLPKWIVSKTLKPYLFWILPLAATVTLKESRWLQSPAIVFQVTVQEIHELMSDQEETEIRVVLYLKYAAGLGYKSAVIWTPDTDIFMILLHHAHSIPLTVFLDTGTGKHRQIINVSEVAELLGNDCCTSIWSLYVFTGEDVTCAFKGKGKVWPLKKLLEPSQVPCSLQMRIFSMRPSSITNWLCAETDQ